MGFLPVQSAPSHVSALAVETFWSHQTRAGRPRQHSERDRASEAQATTTAVELYARTTEANRCLPRRSSSSRRGRAGRAVAFHVSPGPAGRERYRSPPSISRPLPPQQLSRYSEISHNSASPAVTAERSRWCRLLALAGKNYTKLPMPAMSFSRCLPIASRHRPQRGSACSSAAAPPAASRPSQLPVVVRIEGLHHRARLPCPIWAVSCSRG